MTSKTPNHKERTTVIERFVRWGWIPALIGIAYYVHFIWNPLPSDEEMIAHFQAHHADIEELVRRYRSFEPGPDGFHSAWMKQGDTLEVLKRAEIQDIDYSALQPWLPNPYSVETGKTVDNEARNAKTFAMFDKYGALRIKPARSPRVLFSNNSDRYYWNTLLYGTIWKDFYFFPEVPRIENGELLGPMDSSGKYSFRARVFSSLNRLPDHWKDFECVYRQIEPQWFVRMCNGH